MRLVWSQDVISNQFSHKKLFSYKIQSNSYDKWPVLNLVSDFEWMRTWILDAKNYIVAGATFCFCHFQDILDFFQSVRPLLTVRGTSCPRMVTWFLQMVTWFLQMFIWFITVVQKLYKYSKFIVNIYVYGLSW